MHVMNQTFILFAFTFSILSFSIAFAPTYKKILK